MYDNLKIFEKIKEDKLRLRLACVARKARLWAAGAAITVAFMWTIVVYLIELWQIFQPGMVVSPPLREYNSNGYIMVSSNGGLNQMRSGICDMVAIASYMNATLVVPQLDTRSFWHDQSQFKDIFDVDHFIKSLSDEVKIVKELPPDMQAKVNMRRHISMQPISWSDISYYTNKILHGGLKKHKVLHFEKTDSRLANNGPLEIQKLRCKANYNALKFTTSIEKMGKKIVNIMRKRGKFLVLHLRYEKDMLAFSGCNEGCTNEEAKELKGLRYSTPWWKKKEINSTSTRLSGLCPLTPEETALTLKALGVDPKTQIYIAAGDIYGGDRRLAPLKAAYPNLVKKETLLPPSDLLPFKNYASKMAALDYIVSLESDIFSPLMEATWQEQLKGTEGNLFPNPKILRYLGFRPTIQPDQKALVNLIDKYRRNLNWQEFEHGVKKAHAYRYGNPSTRTVIPGKPKEEDYFWSNPHECLQPM